jgi:hypothetical protein
MFASFGPFQHVDCLLLADSGDTLKEYSRPSAAFCEATSRHGTINRTRHPGAIRSDGNRASWLALPLSGTAVRSMILDEQLGAIGLSR